MPLEKSPLSGTYLNTGACVAYLFDAATGPGRLLGGHACLVIEAIIKGVYIIERAEIFAEIPAGQSLLSAAGLISTIKHSVVQVTTKNEQECATKAQGIICSKNYDMHLISQDQFSMLQKTIREEQIKFTKAFLAAFQTAEKTPQLKDVFSKNISKDQEAFLKEHLPKPIHIHQQYQPISIRFSNHCTLVADILNCPTCSHDEKHMVAQSFIELVTAKCFRARAANSRTTISTPTNNGSLFMELFFKLQKIDNGQGGSLLPESFPRFRISGPKTNFKGDAADTDFFNCLAWAKYVLKKATGIQPGLTNKPKKLGGCTIM